MAKTGNILIDPNNPYTIVDAFKDMQQQVDGAISFGDPSDPSDVNSTTRAGAGAGAAFHPGRLANIEGVWVEASLTATGAATFTHNLNLPVFNNGANDEPNVRWLYTNWFHDGQGAGGTTQFTLFFQYGDTVTGDAIDLRLGATAATVDGTHPLLCTVFFTPALRAIEL